jgi:hypothetical protein
MKVPFSQNMSENVHWFNTDAFRGIVEFSIVAFPAFVFSNKLLAFGIYTTEGMENDNSINNFWTAGSRILKAQGKIDMAKNWCK